MRNAKGRTRHELQRAGRTLGRLQGLPGAAFCRALAREVAEDDVFGMAAEMAYRFLFALFPLLLFTAATLGLLGDALGLDDVFSRLLEEARPLLPGEAYLLLEEYVSGLLGARSLGFLTIGLLGILWGAAGGVGTLLKGLNRAYDVERFRPTWQRHLLALAVTATLPPASLLLFVAGALGSALARGLGEATGLAPEVAFLLAWARWPALVALLFLGLSLLYHILPNTRQRYVKSLPGSAFATAGWMLLTQGFGGYLANFGRYDTTYGSLGAVIAFMLWLYLVGVVVLLGAELNALLARAKEGSQIGRRG